MKKIAILFGTLIFAISLSAQSNVQNLSSVNLVDMTSTGPSFPGGAKAMKTFIKENFKYPETAKACSREGKVNVRIELDEKGRILSVELLDKTSDDFAKSIDELIDKMPAWEPAYQNGITRRSTVIMPLVFELN